MKLIMTLLVRDEEDILEENLDFHLSRGIDFFIVTDNLSVDSTPAILERYCRKGLMQVINESADDYSQHKWVTRMARLAVNDYLADWVINNDADEFWWPENTQNLKDHLAAVSNDTMAIKIKRANFCSLDEPESDTHFAERMVWRDTQSVNALGHSLPPKVCHRGLANITVAQGNHSVGMDGIPIDAPINKSVSIFHFPVRSFKQFANKIELGGAAYARNVELDGTVGTTWRYLYNELHKGLLNDYYLTALGASSALTGTTRYVRDERLRQALRALRNGKTQ